MRNTVLFVLLATLTAVSEMLGCYPPPTKRPGRTCDQLRRNLVQRHQWLAKEPSGPAQCLGGPVAYVIIHHTGSGACSTTEDCSVDMRKLQRDHMTKMRWPDVGYHYIIGGDARVYEGRPRGQAGGHTKNHNRKSIGIAFLGNFRRKRPSPRMLDLVPRIIRCAVEQGYLRPDYHVIGHRDAFCSACPGDALYDVIRKWPRHPATSPIPSYACDAPKVSPAAISVSTATSSRRRSVGPPRTTYKGSSPGVGLPVYAYFFTPKEHLTCCL